MKHQIDVTMIFIMCTHLHTHTHMHKHTHTFKISVGKYIVLKTFMVEVVHINFDKCAMAFTTVLAFMLITMHSVTY